MSTFTTKKAETAYKFERFQSPRLTEPLLVTISMRGIHRVGSGEGTPEGLFDALIEASGLPCTGTVSSESNDEHETALCVLKLGSAVVTGVARDEFAFKAMSKAFVAAANALLEKLSQVRTKRRAKRWRRRSSTALCMLRDDYTKQYENFDRRKGGHSKNHHKLRQLQTLINDISVMIAITQFQEEAKQAN